MSKLFNQDDVDEDQLCPHLTYTNFDQRIAGQLRRIDQGQCDGLQHESRDLQNLHLLLNKLQRRNGNKGIRFHLLYEHELVDINAQTLPSRRKVDTRILFSPTVCLSSNVRERTFMQICDVLHFYALISSNTSQAGNASLPQKTTSRQLQSVHNGGAVSQLRNLHNIGLQYALSDESPSLCYPSSVTITFPSWFTGKAATALRSTKEMDVNQSIFSYLDIPLQPKVEWLYRTFFRILHAHARKDAEFGSCTHPSLQYSIFIPPWLPKVFMCGTGYSHYVGEWCLPDLRHQKTKEGRIRLLLILSAFWQKEPAMSESLLRFLRDNADTLYQKHLHQQAQKPVDGRRKRKRTTLPPSEVVIPQHSTVSRVADGVSIFAVVNGIDISCCAGLQCKLQENENAQVIYSPDRQHGFSSKCESCQRPMHHICGQGDDMDARFCPDCQ